MPAFAGCRRPVPLKREQARLAVSTALDSPRNAGLALATLILAGLITAAPGAVAFAQIAGGAGGGITADGVGSGTSNDGGSSAAGFVAMLASL